MEPAALSGCQREIFFDRHARGAAAHGVLKETPDLLGTLVLGGQRDIRTVQRDFAGVGDEASGNRAEERRLACAVCADNGDEVARADMERDIVERKLCVLGAGIEGFRDVCEL